MLNVYCSHVEHNGKVVFFVVSHGCDVLKVSYHGHLNPPFSNVDDVND